MCAFVLQSISDDLRIKRDLIKLVQDSGYSTRTPTTVSFDTAEAYG